MESSLENIQNFDQGQDEAQDEAQDESQDESQDDAQDDAQDPDNRIRSQPIPIPINNFINQMINTRLAIPQIIQSPEVTMSAPNTISNNESHDQESSQNLSNFQQYFIERIQRELEARFIEDEQLNQALLESREEYDEMDTMTRTESAKLDIDSCKYSTIKIKNKRKEICCVCMDNFSCNQEVYRLDCKHIFHKNCLDEWIKYKPECPTCRNTLPVK